MLGDMLPGCGTGALPRLALLVARGKFLTSASRMAILQPRRGFIPLPAEISIVQSCEDGGNRLRRQDLLLIPGDPLNTAPIVVLPTARCPAPRRSTLKPRPLTGRPNGVVIGRPGGNVTVPQDAAYSARWSLAAHCCASARREAFITGTPRRIHPKGPSPWSSLSRRRPHHMMDVAVHGRAQISSWYVLHLSRATHTPQEDDTAANIVARATEITAYVAGARARR